MKPAAVAGAGAAGAAGPWALFDTRLHPEGLGDQDLESMHFFGLRRALVQPTPLRGATPAALRAQFDALLARQLPRLARLGVRAHVALGVHPLSVPRRGLVEVLDALPEYLGEGGAGAVAALGPLGLARGGPAEEEALVEQLRLARRLKLRVVLHAPGTGAEAEGRARRALQLVREARVAPGRVLVECASGRTARLALEVGSWAALTLGPDALPAPRAVTLARRLGPARLALATGAGLGAGDILALARTAHLLARAELGERAVRRLVHANAARWLGRP